MISAIIVAVNMPTFDLFLASDIILLPTPKAFRLRPVFEMLAGLRLLTVNCTCGLISIK